jgi:hypothetical protein
MNVKCKEYFCTFNHENKCTRDCVTIGINGICLNLEISEDDIAYREEDMAIEQMERWIADAETNYGDRD